MKPARGTCATCHWWEFTDVLRLPSGEEIRNGVCLVEPPTPIMISAPAPGSHLVPTGPKLIPHVIGMRPTAHEKERCGEWKPVGTALDGLQ